MIRGRIAEKFNPASLGSESIREQPNLNACLTNLASQPIWMDPARTDSFVREEFARWAPVVRAARVTVDQRLLHHPESWQACLNLHLPS